MPRRKEKTSWGVRFVGHGAQPANVIESIVIRLAPDYNAILLVEQS